MQPFRRNQRTVFHETLKANLSENIVKHGKYYGIRDSIETCGPIVKYAKHGNMIEIFRKYRQKTTMSNENFHSI